MPKDGRDLEDFMPLLEREIARKELCSRWRRMLWTKKKTKKNKEVNNKMCKLKPVSSVLFVE